MPEGVFVVNKIADQTAFGSDSGTITIDLPTSNYLNSIMLRVQNTNGSTSNSASTQTIPVTITKIEITADGVPVYSVTGEMARTIAHFDIGALPAYDETQDADDIQYAVFPIAFGRTDTDKEILLPAHKFATLQMKIEFSFTDSATVGFATSETNAKYDILAKYLVSPTLEDTPFLKHIETYSKTLNTVQEEEIDLPVGAGNGAYRRIFLKAYEADIEDGVDVDKYELVVNDSQRIINQRWDTSRAEDQMRYNASGDKSLKIFVKDNDTFNCKVANIKAVMGNSGVDKQHHGVDVIAGDKLTYNVYDLATPTAITSAGLAYLNVTADGVPFATVIDLGTDDIEDSIDVGEGSGVSSLKVKLNVAATGAVVKCVTEQLVLF